jgi:hypothetical protein
MWFIYSTLTCDNIYAVYKNTDVKSNAIITHRILIKGGHGIANKQLITPYGVMTEINDSDMELLKKDYHFNKHIENGFIKVVRKKEYDVEKASKDLKEKDGSYPKTPKDFEKSNVDQEHVIYKTKKRSTT